LVILETTLSLLFSQDVNPGTPFTFLGVYRCHHTLVATSFELVQTVPMFRELCRLEKVHVYERAQRIQDQGRKAKGSTPHPEAKSIPLTVPRCHVPASAEI
jgi:hypothetical protein